MFADDRISSLGYLWFYGNYSTLDSHTNTVISHVFAYSPINGEESRDKVYYHWCFCIYKQIKVGNER